MILDHIKNIAAYKDIPALRDVIEYILTNDVTTLPEGKTEIHGEDLFCLVQSYTTRDPKQCKPESHKKYIDLQYVLQGREIMGYRPASPSDEVTEANPEGDIWFYKDEDMTDLKVPAGMFAVFYPQDLHSPCQQIAGAEDVKKLVFKISIPR